MLSKIFHLLIIILFVLSAAVQLNDPDPYLWVLAYLNVAVISILILLKKGSVRLQQYVLACIIAYLLVALTYGPDFIDWLQQGAPTITGSMKAEEMHIELVREFLGLIIALGGLAYQWVTLKGQSKATN